MTRKELYSKVGPYILMETLGVGSFGKVKLAVHETTYERYACKILDKRLVKERVMSLQVQKEIDVMRRLRHPNTVSLVSVLSTPSKVFIIMELVTGGELFDEIIKHKRLSEPYARFYFRQLLEGLQYCHDHGIYHRDLKPDNLLLDENGTLKITDFGLSTLKSGNKGGSDAVTGSLTLHTQCGTPNYVAPEIIALQNGDGYSGAKVDAWACGIILYVLVSGSLPFDASEMNVLFKLILRGDLTYPAYFSESLVDLIKNLLRTDPRQRFSLADVKQHEWYNGPIQTLMIHDGPSQSSEKSNLSESPRSVSPDSFLQSHEPKQASLLAQFSIDKPKITNDASKLRRKDSLDECIQAEPIDSEIFLSTNPFSQTMQTQHSQTTTGASLNSDSTDPAPAINEEPTLASTGVNSSKANSKPLPNSINEGELDPLARFKSRELGDGNGSYVPSSDDDHESEHEEVQEITMDPNRIDGSSPGVSNMRRTLSLNDVESFQSKKESSSNNQMSSSTAFVDHPGIRAKLRRQLWDSAANTWRVSPNSFHFGPMGPNQVGSKQRKGSLMSQNHDLFSDEFQQHSKPSLRGSSIRKSRSCAGETTSLVAQLNTKQPHGSDVTKSNGAPKLSSTPSLVRSHSHDGYVTLQPTRRRARTRAKSRANTPSALANEDYNILPADSQRQKPVPSNQNFSKAILSNKAASARKRRNKPGVVRFQDQNQEIIVDRYYDTDDTWVRSEGDKLIWCKIMKDYDMIPDELEFGLDSATLNEKWRRGLEEENLGRKDNFSVYRFGAANRRDSSQPKRYLVDKYRHPETQTHTTRKGHAGTRYRAKEWVATEGRKPDIDPSIEASRPCKESISRTSSNITSSSEYNGKQCNTMEEKAKDFQSMDDSPSATTGAILRISAPVQSRNGDVIGDRNSQRENERNIPMSIPPHMVAEASSPTVTSPGRSSPGLFTRSPKVSYDFDIVQVESNIPTSTGKSPVVHLTSVEQLGRSDSDENELSNTPRNHLGINDLLPGRNDLLPGRSDLLPIKDALGRPKASVEVEPNDAFQSDGEVKRSSPMSSGTSSRRHGQRTTQNVEDAGLSEGSISSSSAHANTTRRSRSDGKSMNSDSGAIPSPVGSTNSACLRSLGSDGIMSTPRDLDVLDEYIPFEDRSAYVMSGASATSDMEISKRVLESNEIVSEDPARSVGVITISEPIRPDPTVLKKEMELDPVKPYHSLKNENGKDPISPFSLDIPGPRFQPLPGPKPILGGLIPNVSSAKKLLRKAYVPLDVKSQTQFHSLLPPPDCAMSMKRILTEYGCRIIKDVSTKSKNKCKVKLEFKRENTSIAATMRIHKLDDEFCAVSFKRGSNVDSTKFAQFYSEIYQRYCEKKTRHSPVRRGWGLERHPTSSGTGVRSITTRSIQERDDTMLQTESSGSDQAANYQRNVEIECVTQSM